MLSILYHAKFSLFYSNKTDKHIFQKTTDNHQFKGVYPAVLFSQFLYLKLIKKINSECILDVYIYNRVR